MGWSNSSFLQYLKQPKAHGHYETNSYTTFQLLLCLILCCHFGSFRYTTIIIYAYTYDLFIYFFICFGHIAKKYAHNLSAYFFDITCNYQK